MDANPFSAHARHHRDLRLESRDGLGHVDLGHMLLADFGGQAEVLGEQDKTLTTM